MKHDGDDIGKTLRAAPMASLLMVPSSREALQLEARLLEDTLEAEQRMQLRDRRRTADAQQSLRSTISAFTADLVQSSSNALSEGFCFRSMNRGEFSVTVASSRQFEAVVHAWKALGLIEEVKGFQGQDDFDGEPMKGRGWATRFRATPKLVSIASEAGITPSAIGDHFKAETGRTFPIELRAKKLSRGRGSGKRMKIDKWLPQVQQLATEVREINQFLVNLSFNLEEAPRFRRIFNNGNEPGFGWNQGGRLYAYGKDSYQQRKPDFRKTITIDGEATVELDIRSSQLTIAYGLAGEPLPSGDLYAVEGLPRDVVKGLVTAFLGKGGRPTRWPVALSKDYLKAKGRRVGQDFTLREVVDRVEAKHQFLFRLNGLGLDVYRLQYVESQILLRAMLRLLREAQAPSLPVHDCLIVRVRDQEKTEIIMKEEFTREVGFSPAIEIK